jgi:hypothetical protein
MSVVAQCQAATKKLETLIASGSLDAAAPVMKEIKLLLIKLGGAGASGGGDGDAEIAAAVAALEAFVVHSVKSRDDVAFGRYFAQLRAFYSKTTTLAATPNQPKVLGLNLVRLLVDNRLADFHAELELLPQEAASSPFVRFPVELERSLMEGMYQQVLHARQKFPDPLFAECVVFVRVCVRACVRACAESWRWSVVMMVLCARARSPVALEARSIVSASGSAARGRGAALATRTRYVARKSPVSPHPLVPLAGTRCNFRLDVACCPAAPCVMCILRACMCMRACVRACVCALMQVPGPAGGRRAGGD